MAAFATAQQDTLIIHFDLNRYHIRPIDTACLDSLARTTGIVSITLAGHTDHTGSDRYNDSLSLLRAQSARRYLLSKGLPDGFFKGIEGYGSQKLRDPAHPASNRRVEITVIRNNPAPSGLLQAFSDTAHLTGKSIILRNVNFYTARHIPLPEAYPELYQLLTVMKQHPRMIIQINGYICCMQDGIDSPDADNPSEPLSVQRAKFVYDFLVEQGIKKERMSYKGFGASNKLYPLERNELEIRANRRVEIKIIGFSTP